ncbi:MAG: tyrosine-type recombinase/integrase [Candidatus Woesearchaeota archaeon]
MGSSIGYQVSTVLSNVATYKMSKERKQAEGIPLNNARDKLKNEGKGRENIYIFNKKTYIKYKNICKKFGNWAKENYGIKKLNQIESSMVAEYFNSRVDEGKSPYTLKADYSAINKLEIALRHKGWIDKDKSITPAENSDFELPRRSKFERVSYRLSYTRSEADQVINSTYDKETKNFFEGQKHLGLRISEARSIIVKNVDIQAGKIHVVKDTKGGKQRHIPIPPEYKEKIKELIKNKSKNQRVYSLIKTSDIYKELKNSCERSGVQNRGTHGFRKVYARTEYARAISQGKSHNQALAITSKLLGHNRKEITLLYLK